MHRIIFKQVPLPDKDTWDHNHHCRKCKKWSTFGIVSYSDKLEKTIFICKTCQPVKLIPAPLPKKTEFKKRHECFSCHKRGKVGTITYCKRCEEGEFICPKCIQNWFDYIEPEKFKYEPLR